MTRFLGLAEVLVLHQQVVEQVGGKASLRDLGALESALAQPKATFGGSELYASVEEKAVAPGFSLILNHPFMDGNKRVGHAAMETMLILNGLELVAEVDDAEAMILAVAAGEASRDQLLAWVRNRIARVDS